MLKRIAVVLDIGRDGDILRWLERQENRSAAIRAAIRAVMHPRPPVDERTLRRVIREELARLRVDVPGGGAAPAAEDVDAEAAARLDDLF